MQRRGLRLALAALVALSLSALGCEVRGFQIEVPGFETMEVLGLWVWRESPGSSEFERYAQIEFGEGAELREGTEFVWYSFPGPWGTMFFQSAIERPGTGDSVNMTVSFVKMPGTFKVSAYNAAGESPLSVGSLVY